MEQIETDKDLDAIGHCLDLRIREFKEHRQLSTTVENSNHGASTSEVLFERLTTLIRDLDAKTSLHITEDRSNAMPRRR